MCLMQGMLEGMFNELINPISNNSFRTNLTRANELKAVLITLLVP